jgi:FkbM family methyltransferase
MTVVLPEVISEAIYTYGLFDETVTWMVLQSVREGSVALDVGAHFGYFTLLLSQLVGPAGHVYAFEPSPSSYEVLASNAGRATNVTPVNRAAGDVTGSTEITDFGLRYSAWNTLASTSRMPEILDRATTARRVNIAKIRLDDYIGEHSLVPGFIKIDAENYEYQVIRGMSRAISRAHPTILLETGSRESRAAGELLLQQGYEMWVSDGPRSLYRWENGLPEANARFKDMLFRTLTPSSRHAQRCANIPARSSIIAAYRLGP